MDASVRPRRMPSAAAVGSSSAADQAISASVGAVVTSVLTTPFEVIKVRQQTAPAGTAEAQRMWPAFRQLVRMEGVRSLWSGLQPTLIMSIPSTVLYLTVYEASRDRLARSSWCATADSADYSPLAAGGGARMVSSAVVSPLELIRTRMQATSGAARDGLIAGARAAVAAEGVAGLWRGLAPTLWRDVPFSCLYWLGYERLKARAIDAHTGQLSPLSAFLAGAVAGSIAAFVTTPLDVVKTRQQVMLEAAANGPSHAPPPANSTLGEMMHILREPRGGIRALFTGLGPRIAKVAPSCAIMITSYELGKRYFASRSISGRTATRVETNSLIASAPQALVSGPSGEAQGCAEDGTPSAEPDCIGSCISSASAFR